MECRRTNPHPSLSTSPSHTPTQSRWTPGPSPETVQPHWAPCAFTGPVRVHPQSHWSPCAFTGMQLQSH